MAKHEVTLIFDDSTTPPTVSVKPPPPVPDSTPEPPPPPAPIPTPAGYRTDGRYLNDPAGKRVVVRGAEQVFWDASWLPTSIVTEVGKSGANTIRILPDYTINPPTGEPRSKLAQIEDMIRRGLDAHMLVDVAIDGGKKLSTYTNADVLRMLLKYDRYIVLHAMGESYADSDEAWAGDGINAVKKLRAAGYTCPLYIMSRTGGRNLPCVLNAGQRVVDADPLHNVVFGWQAYWGSNGAYQSQYGMSLEQAMLKVAQAPFPIQVGLLHRSDPQDNSAQTVPYKDLMQLADEYQLGWLWWDWRMGIDNLTADGSNGRFGAWTGYGRAVVEGEYGITRTSVRTNWQKALKAP